MKQHGWVGAVVVGLLLILCGQIVHAVKGESLTWDEGDHIFAGYEMWKTGDYGLNPEHPPMVKLVATLPLLGLPLKVPPLQGRPFKDEAYLDGRELLFRNGPADGGHYGAQTLIFRVRMFAMVFTVIAALLVFFAGREMFGVGAGLAGLFLFCFEPNLLAHGAYVTTDMGAACTFLATVYAFWRWVKRPTWQRLLVAGLAAGLALAAKHSAVLLLPMLVVVVAGELAGRWRAGERPGLGRNALRMTGAVAAVVVVGVMVLWAFYGFRYATRPPPLVMKPTLTAFVGPLSDVEGKGILLAAKLHVLPESWLYGLTDVRAVANGTASYFLGRIYTHGVWFYFPVLFTIKTTLGMLGLLLLTAFAAARGWLRRWRELWFLAAPPAVYLAVAMESKLNIGARHILPVWVFCCVLGGAGAAALARRGRAWAWTVGLLLAMHAASTVWASPNYLSYANEAWGGPTKTYRYLSDSNTDWAQQLIATSAYLREHNVQDCWIAYFAEPVIQPKDYGVPCKPLPTPDSGYAGEALPVPTVIDGPVLISAGVLTGFELGSKVLNPYQQFVGMKPVAVIQDGIFVYDGRFELKLASATRHVLEAKSLMTRDDDDGAVREAQAAEAIAPGEVVVEVTLGDALAAAGKMDEAIAAYERARPKIETMEPGAKADWQDTLKDDEDEARNPQ